MQVHKRLMSIVICTYNRANSLKDTLNSLIAQKGLDTNMLEIIIVDNNSSDDTQSVIEVFKNACAVSVNYIKEVRQGVAFARNSGQEASDAEWIVYLDDDVLVNSKWLQRLEEAIKRNDADIIAGRILQRWDQEKPSWFSDRIGAAIISQDFGQKRIVCRFPMPVLTANLAIRKDVFKKCGAFDVNLGRKGNRLLGGEDIDFINRAYAEGYRVMYEPKVCVMHKVEPERLEKKWMERWFYDYGISLAHVIRRRWYHVFTVMPMWAWVNAFRRWSWYGLTSLGNRKNKSSEWFAARMWALNSWGMFVECFCHWLPDFLSQRLCRVVSAR